MYGRSRRQILTYRDGVKGKWNNENCLGEKLSKWINAFDAR